MFKRKCFGFCRVGLYINSSVIETILGIMMGE
jgi:hypothetical protein